MASNLPGGGLPANEGDDHRADLPSRPGAAGQPAHIEARAELRDRETYFTELRFAVHCQSRSIPAPRPALEEGADHSGAPEDGGIVGESWDEIIARFGDTWT